MDFARFGEGNRHDPKDDRFGSGVDPDQVARLLHGR
jgi:hypothetical protein